MMKKILTCCALSIAVVAVIYGQSAVVRDTTFGINGVAYTGLKDVFNLNYGNNFAVAADGSIVCSGGVWVTTSSASFIDQRAYRIHPDGNIDPSFYFSSGNIETIAPVILPDGKILLCWDTKLSRFYANGQPDSTFGTNGTSDFNLLFTWNKNILLQQDGKIIVFGTTSFLPDPVQYFAAARLLENGDWDTSFGLNGIVKYNFGPDYTLNIPFAMREYPNGQLIMAGDAYNSDFHVGLIKLNTDGSLDTTFGDNGLVNTGFQKYAECYGMDLMSDGKIVISGYSTTTYANNYAALQPMIARFNVDGSLDSGFYGVGVRYFPASGEHTDLAVTDDDKIVFCGTQRVPGHTVTYVGGVLANGENDPAFGDSSLIVFDQMYARSRTIQDIGDSTLLISGNLTDDDNNYLIRLLRAPVVTSGLWRSGEQLPTLIYPNPVADVLQMRFELPEKASVTIKLLDVKGALVHTWFAGRDYDAGENTVRLDFPGQLTAGTYVVHLSNGEKSVAMQVIKKP